MAGRAVPGVLPDEYRALERYGFDLAGFYARAAHHPARHQPGEAVS